jgi:hypothetical protein
MSKVLGGGAGDGGAAAPVRASRSSRVSPEVDLHATDVGHCPRCGRVWRSNRQAHCCACHRHFASDTAFDRHLDDEGCSSPKRLRNRSGEPIFKLVELAGGPAWAIADERPHPFAEAAS